MDAADVVVVGGGAIGCAVACFLRMRANPPRVVVVERDPTYALASTPRASGGVRRLFSGPENIQLSNFSIPFYERFAEEMAVEGERAEINFRKGGYLFIVDGRGVKLLEESAAVQRSLGVRLDMLDRAMLRDRFPSMRVDDLDLAVHSLDDAWVDPHSVQQGFRRKARALGATFLAEEVAAIEREGPRIRSVSFASGGTLRTDAVVNAAGAWADQICAMIGMKSPIRPMRRFEHYFECATPIEPLPYVKDLDRLAFRPEGRGYTGGKPDSDEPRGFNFDIDHSFFERVVWPALAHRFPAFEWTKEKNVMAGLYDQNELDGNGIIGPWPECPGFLMAAGFSGHGLMHAPGVGRAIAELILDGGFRSIDLARLGWDRVARNEPYRERGII
jgi:glycine/D-amino acid oxidase-like deaminating enzyme